MSLGEAMASGLAVIAFDCPYGPREIITVGLDGVLVPPLDANALGQAMASLMADAAERRRLAANAPRILDRFGTETVMWMWEDLIGEIRRPVSVA